MSRGYYDFMDKHPTGNTPASTIRHQIEDQAEQLSSAIASLNTSISILSDRLSPVIHPENSVAGDLCAQAPEAMLVPLAHNIREMRNRVEHASVAVNGILSRLEL